MTEKRETVITNSFKIPSLIVPALKLLLPLPVM